MEFLPALVLTGDLRLPLALLLVFVRLSSLPSYVMRVRIPGNVGEILAGVALGPSVLAWISPSELLSTLAELGAMFLLFRVGLEVKPSELMRVGGTATLVATSGVIFPWFLDGDYDFWAESDRSRIHGCDHGRHQRRHHSPGAGFAGLLSERAEHSHFGRAVIDDVLGLLGARRCQ